MAWLDRWRKPKKILQSSNDSDLFDEQFQRKLDYLAIVSRRVFAGRMRAERKTKKSGSGIEFVDHREYTEGDDIRSLDWNLYQRFGKLMVRLFEEEEDLAIYFIIDTSSSMGFNGGLKLRQAKRLAAALGYVGLSNLDRVAVTATTDRISSAMQPTRGKQHIFKVFRFLTPLKADGTTNLGTALKAFAARNKRRGLAVLLSDLYDPAGFEHGINALRFSKFEPFVLHIVEEKDAKPELAGDVRLYDCETGEEREVTVTSRLLEKYQESYDDYLKTVERFCARKQVPYFAVDVHAPFDEMVLRVFRRGGFLK
jgi:uncharacterized protein (DUF58 family)